MIRFVWSDSIIIYSLISLKGFTTFRMRMNIARYSVWCPIQENFLVMREKEWEREEERGREGEGRKREGGKREGEEGGREGRGREEGGRGGREEGGRGGREGEREERMEYEIVLYLGRR